MLAEALEYAKRGWLVFPLHGFVDGKCTCRLDECPDAGKHPVTRRGWKDASRDPEVISAWFVQPYNIGIVCGQESGITVLDIDVGKKKGDATWASLTKEKGEPQTLMSQTGSGGIHVIFKYNSVLKSSSNTLGEGVDCRNDGGYIVAPPSNHRSGGKYSWLNQNEILDIPEYLTKKPEKAKKAGKKRKKEYSVSDVKNMLDFVPADDRDLWRSVGIILGREFDRSEEAWACYSSWSDKWDGVKGRNHDAIMREAFYELSADQGELSLGTILKHALDHGWSPPGGSIDIDNFMYYAPGNEFIYRPTREFWQAGAVDSASRMVNDGGELKRPSDWLRQKKLITSMTNDPLIDGEILQEHDCLHGVMVPSKGGALYNAYRPPIVSLGDASKAGPWTDHVRKVFPLDGDADQFIDYIAHRVQRPGEKPRFALVLVGEQGVGKDTAIAFAMPAMGEWNVESIKPEEVSERFNEYVSKVLVIVSEVSNSEDMSKWSFNERMKVLIAGTPDYMMCNPKYGHKFSVRLHNGVIITTNHLHGLYLPEDDRRYDVIHTPTRREMFGTDDPKKRAEYFRPLYSWLLKDGGARHVAAFLHERDLSKFDASNGQRITQAHREIVASGYDSDQWVMDALHKLGNPAVTTFSQIWSIAESDSGMSKKEAKTRLGHAMPRIGFNRLVNEAMKDGRWMLDGVMTVVYFSPEKIAKPDAVSFVRQGKARREVF